MLRVHLCPVDPISIITIHPAVTARFTTAPLLPVLSGSVAVRDGPLLWQVFTLFRCSVPPLPRIVVDAADGVDPNGDALRLWRGYDMMRKTMV
jgi:hypothetical protein